MSLLRILSSFFLGADRLGLEEALERFSMFLLLLSGACFVYFHPVFGILERKKDSYRRDGGLRGDDFLCLQCRLCWFVVSSLLAAEKVLAEKCVVVTRRLISSSYLCTHDFKIEDTVDFKTNVRE